MLLQKTSWRIKQFISHRKDAIHEIVDHDASGELKVPTSNTKRHSWLSQTPLSEATTTLRRASSNANSRSPQLVIPANATANSSASSLCSCDCGPDSSPNEDSLSKALTSRPQAETLYLPSVTPPITLSDVRRWQLIFTDPFAGSLTSDIANPNSSQTSASTIAAGSMLDLKEALGEIDPLDDDKTPTQSIRSQDESDMQSASEDVEQLARERDEAFQAINSALVEAKAISHDWYDDDDAPIIRNFAVSRNVPRRPSRAPISPIKPTIGRNTSVTKTKAKKSKFVKRKTNVFGRALHNVPPPPVNTPSRWTLMDVTTNMADVFSGKMFRTEVDEMLTPGRIQKLKEEKIDDERPSSKDSSQSGETDGSTPTEPFHLESLSSRISAALSKDPPRDTTVPLLDKNTLLERLPKRKGLQRRQVKFADLKIPPQFDPEMTINDLTFPSPPRTPRRPSGGSGSGSGSRSGLLLPTIPEISPLSLPVLCSPSPFPDPLAQLQPQPPLKASSYILLPSTPFTAHSPGFRHGSIRVERINPSVTARKGSSPEGETLDWTAFQMAISGTMESLGDVQPLNDSEWEANEAELDALIEWFEGFGFEGWGRLVNEGMETTMASRKSQPKNTNQPDGGALLLPQLNSSTKLSALGNKFENPRKGSLTPSEKSLPPSPMLDLLVQGEEVIPMGFNLGHDLGDFLKWESDCVQSRLVGD